MSDLFFYGSLRYIPLLELVLGKPAADLNISPAHLAGHQTHAVKGEAFPIIVAAEGAAAEGLLVRDLDDQDVAALNFYEGGFDYALKPVHPTLADGTKAAADVYFAEAGRWQAGDVWHLDRWISDWGAMTLRAAREIMAYKGRITAQDAAHALPSARRRASAWLAAQEKPQDPQRDLARDVIVHGHKHAHIGFFAYEEMDLQFRQNDGEMSPVMNRAAFMNGRASVVLPYDPVQDKVLLVEQFRAAVYMGGETRPWMWEPVAGLVDPGETPEQAARRESLEEAGLTVQELELVGEIYPSSGCLTEILHVFVGISDFSTRSGGGGLAGEGEDIRSEILPFETLMERIDAQAYQDMPLVTCGLWLARHRDRLRAKYG